MRKGAAKVILSMALSLAVATSFMGSTAEAKMQEGRQAVTVKSTNVTHPVEDLGLLNEPWCEESNSEYHAVYDWHLWRCTAHTNCPFVETRTKEQIGYEQHNLRGATQPPYRFYCLDCGYIE